MTDFSTEAAQPIDIASALLQSGFNTVLQMPTGSGKTWRAAQAMLVVARRGMKAVYVTPTRALANELYEKWTSEWTDTKVGIFTGDYGSERDYPVPYSDAQVLIMTPERLDLCTRQWRQQWHWLPAVDLVVVDEVHLLSDPGRGARLEGAIIRIRTLNPFARIVALSATVGNPETLAAWLDGAHFRSSTRPIPLAWRTLTYSRATDKPQLLAAELERLQREGGKAIVFVQSKRRSEELAAFLRGQGISAEHHHGGLTFESRLRIEHEFRSGAVEVLIATGTLEVGLNLPARLVVLYDLQQFDGEEFKPLSVISAWQRAGRAGRPGQDSSGEVVLLRARWERAITYENGDFESIQSQLSQPERLAEQVITAISSRYARNVPELHRYFEGSLIRTQRGSVAIADQVQAMCDADFIQTEQVEGKAFPTLRPTPLGRLCTRLLVSPATILKAKAALMCATQWSYFDLLLLCSTLPDCAPILTVDFEEISTLETRLSRAKSHVLQEQGLQNGLMDSLSPRRRLSAVKAALLMLAWTESGNHECVSNEMSVYPGEVVQLRETCMRLIAVLVGLLDQISQSNAEVGIDSGFIKKKLRRLEIMIRCGLNDDNATLTMVPGIGAKWARKLAQAGILDIEALAQAEPQALIRLGGIGRARAEKWVDTASDLLKSDDLFLATDSARHVTVHMESIDRSIDVYRLKRSWQLHVAALRDAHEFIVTGGADPHHIDTTTLPWHCDCADRAKGNECKHLLAVRRSKSDPTVLAMDERLLQKQASSGIDLRKWWAQ